MFLKLFSKTIDWDDCFGTRLNGWPPACPQVYDDLHLAACLLLLPCLYLLGSLWAARKVATPKDFHVIVIGAGPGGICTGKRLNDLGIR